MKWTCKHAVLCVDGICSEGWFANLFMLECWVVVKTEVEFVRGDFNQKHADFGLGKLETCSVVIYMKLT